MSKSCPSNEEKSIKRHSSFVGKLSNKTKTIFKASSWHSGMKNFLSKKDSTMEGASLIPLGPGEVRVSERKPPDSHRRRSDSESGLGLRPPAPLYPSGRVIVHPDDRPPLRPRDKGGRRRNRSTSKEVAPLPRSLAEKVPAQRCKVCGCRLPAGFFGHACRTCEGEFVSSKESLLQMAFGGKAGTNGLDDHYEKENIPPLGCNAASFMLKKKKGGGWAGRVAPEEGWTVGDEKEAEEKGLIFMTEGDHYMEEKATPARKLTKSSLVHPYFTPSKIPPGEDRSFRSPTRDYWNEGGTLELQRSNSVPPSFGSPLRGLSISPGGPPRRPDPPESRDITATSINLYWSEHLGDDLCSPFFRIQGRKFGERDMAIWYEGPDREYEFSDLHSHTVYIFKLEVITEDGISPESNAVAYRTLQQPRANQEDRYDLRLHTQQALMDFRLKQQEMYQNIPLQRKYDELLHRLNNHKLDRHLAEGRSFDPRAVCRINISRKSILEESLMCLSVLSAIDLLMPLRVEFQEEEGVDSGSIVKEWFLMISDALFDPSAGLFQCSDQGNFKILPKYESPDPGDPEISFLPGMNRLSLYHFFGRLVAKALLDGHTLGVHLDLFLMKFILDEPVDVEDLRHSDEQLYQSLKWTLNYDISEADLGSFTVSVRTDDGLAEVDLVEEGSSKNITEENKEEYVTSLLRWLVDGNCKEEKEAMLQGLQELIPRNMLQNLSSLELQTILCGEREIDLEAVKAEVQYKGGYTENSDQIKWFWQAVLEMTPDQQRRLLQFCTGSDSLPIKGFNPPLTITRSYMASLRDLPTSHACFNQLAIPEYKDPETLSEKLEYAISNTNGFHLT